MNTIDSESQEQFHVSSVRYFPEEWDNKTLLDAVGMKKDLIVAGPFGSNLKVSDYKDEGIPIIRLQNIDYGKFIDKEIKYISHEKARELAYHSFRAGDLVLAKLGDPIGKTCIVPDYFKDGIVVADVVRVRVADGLVDKKFIMYSLNSVATKNQLINGTIGSTRPRVNLDQIRDIQILVPPLNEQRKIAAILSSVDAAIEQTDAIIAQTERMKTGLMQYVFVTKAAQKKWEITNLSRLAQIEMGQSPPGSTYNEIGDGMPLINGPTEFGQSCPKPIQWTTNPTKVCKKGDILFCVRGSSTGRLNSADREYCIGRGVAAIRGKSNKGSTLFIRHYLMHEVPRIYKLAAGGGSTFPNITSTLLNAYPCCSPSLQEQCKIANIFLSIDQRLECENQYRNNLCLIQRGLMRDLLTGRVRVKVDEHA
jgi:type I restriction enzyme S subunit